MPTKNGAIIPAMGPTEYMVPKSPALKPMVER